MPAFRLEDYETVEERLSRFWDKHPDGRVLTELVFHSEQQFIVRAEVFRDADDQRPAGSGYAEEQVGSSLVNKTSALENAETSAVGRALAQLGYAAKGKRPSREEMQKSDAAPSSRAQGTASDRSGEGQANPGESGASQTSPEHPFPVDPLKCDHRKSNGAWIGWVSIPPDFEERCPKCGTPKLVAMESTTADLGPAT